jgi:hypothetical protein
MKTVYLVRHGQSVDNVLPVFRRWIYPSARAGKDLEPNDLFLERIKPTFVG